MKRKSTTTTLVNKWKSRVKKSQKGRRDDLKGFDVEDRLNGLHLIKKAAQLRKKSRKKRK